MLTLVEGGLSYVRELAPRRRADRTTFHHAHVEHQTFLETPFLEAQAALRARVSQR
jgi:hypothetical protein